ncbi:hypothetical protein [Agrococcus carbonis]|uniref:Uncharacterized protein n=1 Tax=Agrococcus carbonis TaxID=684552 RepID=A0A1H1Q2I7_9MICO|nr:hypothetical protein [Agrococcus carbonis]SDS17645.1 hypothetical protein SAMN04489719_1716 [Agrococcus carbonis]
MRSAHGAVVRRAVGALGVAAVTSLALAGCIPPPPAIPPTGPTAVPSGPQQPLPSQGDARPGSAPSVAQYEGRVEADGTATIELRISERAAVVLGATSPDGGDLRMRLVGDQVSEADDDSIGELDVFSFQLTALDPALDPGTYTVELEEFAGDATDFELEILTGTTVVAPGETAAFAFEPGIPVVALVPLATGDERILATSDVDTRMWAFVPGADIRYDDDDSGGDLNPLIALAGEQAQDVAVVVGAYFNDEAGDALLSVE